MLTADPEYLEVVQGSHRGAWSASAVYGATQTVDSVPLTPDGSITTDSSGQIQTTGNVFVAKQDDKSLMPHNPSDPLAPCGQELALTFTVMSSGGKSWSFPMGRLRISDVPSMKEYFRRWPNAADKTYLDVFEDQYLDTYGAPSFVAGPSRQGLFAWECKLELADRFDIIDADDFHKTTAPLPGGTVLSELQRLSPIPLVIPSFVVDVPVAAGTTYQSRIDAVQQLAGLVGCAPALTREGALTLRVQNRWLTETVPDFTLDGVIDMDDSMSLSIKNSVSVTCPSDDTIFGFAEITDESNPFAVSRPIGRRTAKQSNPLMDTQAKADAAALTMRDRLSTPQARTATVTCALMPHIEAGDFGKIIDPVSNRTVLGQVASLSWPLDVTQPMQMKILVAGVS